MVNGLAAMWPMPWGGAQIITFPRPNYYCRVFYPNGCSVSISGIDKQPQSSFGKPINSSHRDPGYLFSIRYDLIGQPSRGISLAGSELEQAHSKRIKKGYYITLIFWLAKLCGNAVKGGAEGKSIWLEFNYFTFSLAIFATNENCISAPPSGIITKLIQLGG